MSGIDGAFKEARLCPSTPPQTLHPWWMTPTHMIAGSSPLPAGEAGGALPSRSPFRTAHQGLALQQVSCGLWRESREDLEVSLAPTLTRGETEAQGGWLPQQQQQISWPL